MRKILLAVIVALNLWSCNTSLVELETDMLRIKVNDKGFITSFQDKETSREYMPKGVKCPLLTLYKDSIYIEPVNATYNKEKLEFSLDYGNGSIAIINIEPKSSYFKMALKSVEPRNDIQAVQWGPFATTLDKWIGEAIGVVRNDDYAIGVQALNTFTVEGSPDMTNDFKMVIDPLPGQYLPDSLKSKIGSKIDIDVNKEGDMPNYVRIYRGIAAMKDNNGSILLMHAKDRRIPQIVGSGENIQYIAPVDQDFAGTAIALFGCPESTTLNVIETIELAENLPHPMINGEWIKRSNRFKLPYLLYEGDSIDNALKYVKLFGFELAHIGDLFESWGHFGLKTKRFPDGANGIRKYTDKAGVEGISLGVHTLTKFTSPNDPYISPIPSDSLAKTGSSILVKEINPTDDIIYIESPQYFINKGITNTIKIDKELIRYTKVVEEPYRLEGCSRGQYGTTPQTHQAGVVVDKLTNNCYSGFYPDIHLQEAYAIRLAEVCNDTGLGLIDFDGYGYSPIGYDTYANAKFMDIWYKHLKKPVMICGSQPSHYFWHIYTFMNWGEPWYNALRQSQVNYRIENQRFFERNFMPGMLGWFSLHSDYRPEDIEWIQARSVAFDAGYLLRVDENSIEKNGFIDQISEAVREWQKARRTGAFPKDLIEEMKDPKKEFHLKKTSENSWDISPINLALNAVEFGNKQVQTGEPIAVKTVYSNHFNEQAIQFYLFAYATDGDKNAFVSNLSIELNNSEVLLIDCTILADERIWCDGENLYLCDKYWKILKQLSISSLPRWRNGDNEIRITGEFSSESAPILSFDFKSIGQVEQVRAN